MKNRKTTRRALFSSVISLILCCAMLVGTTFAWFTDSVSSGINHINAGNLDVELYYGRTPNPEQKVSENELLFKDVENKEIALWEPGVVAYTNLKVVNEGDLALKYQLSIDAVAQNYVLGEDGKQYTLTDVLKLSVVEGGVQGTTREAVLAEAEAGNVMPLDDFVLSEDLEKAESSVTYGLVVYWSTNNEDDFDNIFNLNNGKESSNQKALGITLGVDLFATQLEAESDSFNENYDADLEMPAVGADVVTVDALEKALQEGKAVKLMGDLVLTRPIAVPAGINAAIDLNGYTLTISREAISTFSLRASGGWLEIFGSLIITDTSDDKSGAIIIDNGSAGIVVNNGAALQIDDGKIDVNSGTGIQATGNASIDVKGGKITASVDAATAIAVVPGDNADSKADIVIGDGATVDNIDVAAGADAKVTFYGNKAPEMTGDGAAENTVHKGTSFEDVTQDPKKANQYYIDSKEGLMNLNAFLKSVAPGEGNVITVDLLTDVDLVGEEWAPIESMWVVFNGNKHTIKNVNAGMASDGRRSGFWGYAGAVTINELTLENVTVSGSQAGIFVGAAEGTKINNCYVKGTNTVTYEAGVEEWCGIGAITGVLQSSNINVEIVEGATVTLNRGDMVTAFGCTYIDDLTGHLGTNSGTITNNGTVTATGSMAYVVSSAADLKAAIKARASKIYMSAGNYNVRFTNNTDFNVDNMTIIGEEGVNLSVSSSEVWYGRVQGDNVTFENIHFTSSVGATGKATYNNCTFDDWTICASGVNKETYFNNCDIKGTLNTSVDFSSGNTYVTDSTVAKAEFSGAATMYFTNCQIGELISHDMATVLKNCVVEKQDLKMKDKKVTTITTDEEGLSWATNTADPKALVLNGVSSDYAGDTIVVPEGVTGLGSKALQGNTTIKEVEIPSTLTDFSGVVQSDGKGASGGFFYKSAVEKVVLPDGMTEIPAATFNQAANLKEVNIPTSVNTIGVNAFAGCGLEELTIPATVTSIGYGAFRDMDSLTTVTIEGDAVTLPGYVFRDCSALRTVYLNMNTLTLNGSQNFANASSNNPGTNNITFYCKNYAVADAVLANMGTGSYVAIYVNGTLYEEIK